MSLKGFKVLLLHKAIIKSMATRCRGQPSPHTSWNPLENQSEKDGSGCQRLACPGKQGSQALVLRAGEGVGWGGGLSAQPVFYPAMPQAGEVSPQGAILPPIYMPSFGTLS